MPSVSHMRLSFTQPAPCRQIANAHHKPKHHHPCCKPTELALDDNDLSGTLSLCQLARACTRTAPNPGLLTSFLTHLLLFTLRHGPDLDSLGTWSESTLLRHGWLHSNASGTGPAKHENRRNDQHCMACLAQPAPVRRTLHAATAALRRAGLCWTSSCCCRRRFCMFLRRRFWQFCSIHGLEGGSSGDHGCTVP